MSFASPGYLALLALAPLAAAAYLSLARWRRRAAGRFAPGRDAWELSPAVSTSRRTLKAALVVLAVAALAVALAGPRFGQQEVVVQQAGADVVIALDVSRSMLAGDVEPSRLALAQQEMLTLLERLRGHRVGLVIFARSALLRSPLTSDMAPLRALVQSAQQDGALLAPGSDLGAAVRTATRALEAGEAESKAIILVSDGEDHQGDALAAARDAVRRGILVFAAGVGTETGAPVPAIGPEIGFPVPSGETEAAPVVTRRNEDLLRLIAATSRRGDYVPGEELAGLADAIDRLERTAFASERQRRPIERFQWAVLAALALLMLEGLLPERRGGWWPRLRPDGRASARFARAAPPAGLLGGLVLLALLGVACGSTAGSLIAEGNRAYERGEYGEALEAYRRAGARAPDRPEPHLNAGLALHRLERYEEAAAETARALPIDDPLQAARVHYNLGSHYFRLGRLVEALASFREALLLNPDDQDAKHNLELVVRMIQELPAEDAAQRGAAEGRDILEGEGAPSAGGEGRGGGDGDDLAGQTEAAQRTLAEAVAGIEEEFTVEEALRALDLAQGLNRLLPLVEPREVAGASDQPDY